MKRQIALLLTAIALAPATQALSMDPNELVASRQLACVLAQQSLGSLSENEYGTRMHNVLDGFDEAGRDAVLGKAVGYFDGLMFSITDTDTDKVNRRLESFVDSPICTGPNRATVSL